MPTMDDRSNVIPLRSPAPVPPPVSAPCSAELPPVTQLAPDFGDPIAHLNIRKWVQVALEAKGATITGAGMGFGQADLDVEIDGAPFNVSIRPIIRGAHHGR